MTLALAIEPGAAAVAAGGPADALGYALVYLLAAVVAVPLAKRIGMGSVLGYLAAGVVIGPAGVDLVGDTSEVMHFAEFGVVMMLFLIGLELRPRALWEMRSDVLGLGGLQVGLTAAAIAGLSMAVGLTPLPAVAIGLTLALSSTAIVLQTLSERGLSDSPPGRRAFSVLLFQDIAVIPILAALPLLAAPDAGAEAGASASHIADLPAGLQAAAILGTILAIVLGGRLLARPLFRAVASTHLRELFSATALLVVVGISLLMGFVGLSAALGTFLAGVVLAESEYRHELESDLEPFKGLLLGLFFITVGASIDFGLVFERPAFVCGLVLALVGVKGGILFGLTRLWKIPKATGTTLALILSQGGEFGFVLVATSRTLDIYDEPTGMLVTAVVALSMAATPLLLLLDEHVLQPRFAKGSDAPEREDDMPADRKPPVIIAGFGRYGQAAGRMLVANGIDITVLDLDPGTVDLLREHGMPVYYGDATRPALLHAAGCADAKLFVIATDSTTHSIRIAGAVRQHHPHVKIVSRAYDVRQAHILRGEGVDETVCDVNGGGLALGRASLIALGYDPYRAERAMKRFERHEGETQRMLFEALGDPTRTLQVARQRTADLGRLLEADSESEDTTRDSAWSTSAAIEAARD
ncbi:MAG: monovalent cation:proton antiporter-2 (CPA2) family protein [Planctomycetota bacterium]